MADQGKGSGDTSRRGFASMDEARQREIASEGGKASGGNFKNDPGRAAEAGRKGGENSGGNFKNDPESGLGGGPQGGRKLRRELRNDRERASEAAARAGAAERPQHRHRCMRRGTGGLATGPPFSHPSGGAQQHAEQVARVVGVGDHVELGEQAGLVPAWPRT